MEVYPYIIIVEYNLQINKARKRKETKMARLDLTLHIYIKIIGRMDDLRIYVLFNSISVIS